MEKTMTINIPDIAGMVGESLTKAFSPEAIQATIDKCCGKVAEEAIGNMFGYGGTIKKQMEAIALFLMQKFYLSFCTLQQNKKSLWLLGCFQGII